MAASINLFDELINILRTYSQRLDVLERTFRDSGEELALSITENLTAIRRENQRTFAKLQTGLCKRRMEEVQSEDGGEFTLLSSLWRTERMKIIYLISLQQLKEGSNLCFGWKDRPDVLQAMRKHNVNVMGNENKAHTSICTYPGLVKDHLFNIKNILNECLKIVLKGEFRSRTHIETALRRVDSLIEWLDAAMVNLHAKKIQHAKIPESVSYIVTSEPLLRRDIFNLPVHNHLDAQQVELFLGSKYVTFRFTHDSHFKSDRWEFGSIEELDVEEGDDDYTFHLYGVGLRKILTAKSNEIRDDWMEAIIELRDAMADQKHQTKIEE